MNILLMWVQGILWPSPLLHEFLDTSCQQARVGEVGQLQQVPGQALGHPSHPHHPLRHHPCQQSPHSRFQVVNVSLGSLQEQPPERPGGHQLDEGARGQGTHHTRRQLVEKFHETVGGSPAVLHHPQPPHLRLFGPTSLFVSMLVGVKEKLNLVPNLKEGHGIFQFQAAEYRYRYITYGTIGTDRQ